MTQALRKADMAATVRVDGVRFGWTRDEPILDIGRLDIEAGERILIQGASGSGKTTLLSLLAGILVPQAGSIEISGATISAMPASGRDRFRADHIGFVFQQFNLLPYLSVRENVLLPRAFSERRAMRASPRQADALLDQLGLDAKTFADRPATSLSIGQQQRVAVARALIGAPDILIADEPTSALDADARDAFLRLVFAECARAGITLVLVSHDPSLIPLFDRAVRLADINRADGTVTA
ncbi:MAG TPA: ABC transporter ATP-binding protein [Dokdonella sp.]|nr:ABC transporter ATP-binding protein [Dokdonella sp.]